MTIKNSIDNLINHNAEVGDFIKASYQGKGADQVIIEYVDFLKKSNYNSALSLSFANLLQFCSDPTLEEQFENSDIQRLFESLLVLYEQHSKLLIDAAKFEHERMNNRLKAKQIVEKGINELEVQLKELRELAEDLNS
jgi:hypothetical protein